MKSFKLPLTVVAIVFLFVVFGFLMTRNVKNQDTIVKENIDITKEAHHDSNIVNSTEKDPDDEPLWRWDDSIWEHFNPEQIDFSKEYLELVSKKRKNVISQFIGYDFSSVWLSSGESRNGVLGQNYQRIQIHFSKITRSLTDSTVYLVEGKSKVNNNICNFKGEIKPIRLFFGKCEGYDEDYASIDSTSKCGILKAEYTFYEDSTKNHSGIFTGVAASYVLVDSIKKTVSLDQTLGYMDGYNNNTFVGIWTNYKTKQSKKCIWGDYRLPFTRDFDCGAGEMEICDKYVKNGWQTFNLESIEINGVYKAISKEHIEVNGKWELKDKWWKK